MALFLAIANKAVVNILVSLDMDMFSFFFEEIQRSSCWIIWQMSVPLKCCSVLCFCQQCVRSSFCSISLPTLFVHAMQRLGS